MDDVIYKLKRDNLKNYLQEYEGHVFKGEMTLCPFHEDHTESLSVYKRGQVWLWHCHSCKIGGSIIDYTMMKHNLDKGAAIRHLKQHLRIQNPRSSVETQNRDPKIVARYSYTDQGGKEVYCILRYQPKTFKADRKVSSGNQVFYHLPEVVKAETVWLVEGEKDCDNVRTLGLIATTGPFGKSNWQPQFTRALAGKKVMICMDIGAEVEAEDRARKIASVAKEVRIIRLPGLDKTGQDISDWFEIHDAQNPADLRIQLEEIAQKTALFEPKTFAEIKSELQISNDFLRIYLEHIAKVTDAPCEFIVFSGLALLSAILHKFYFFYPRKTPLNLYILLLAESTVRRKSVCTDIASDYLAEVNPELLFPESFTSEALLEILAKRSRGLLTWRELIQVKEFQFGSDYNRGLPSLLTDLYDFKPLVRRWTKGEGETTISEPILSILAAGIASWLVDSMRKIDFQGGIWTRFLFVPANEDIKPKFRLPERFIINLAILEKLRLLNSLEPKEMNLDKIKPLMLAWGSDHLERIQHLKMPIAQASFSRLEVALVKIACLLQLAQNQSTIIEPETFQEAVGYIEFVRSRLSAFFEEEIAFSELDKTKGKIIKLLRREGMVTKRYISRHTSSSPEVISKALAGLLNEGRIIYHQANAGERGRPREVYQIAEGSEDQE
jgi:hypothetical protein